MGFLAMDTVSSTDHSTFSRVARDHYQSTRQFTDRLTSPLTAEDCVIQSMDDVSPTRWHLAHTTWFFETFLLREQSDYDVFDEQFNFLFNSYYNTIGEQYPRAKRGLLSRPGLDAIREYRAHVDRELVSRLQCDDFVRQHQAILQIGIQHEQQHQELILTDIKHVLSCNPLFPKYSDAVMDHTTERTGEWIEIPAGLHQIGHHGDDFCFDNELPRHQVHLMGSELATDLVTCGEYLEFIQAGGYQQPEHWLSLGWNTVNLNNWRAPMYWIEEDGQWMMFTLNGLVPIDLDWPVCHVCLFEADAYARWKGMRLPTEFEWEVGANESFASQSSPQDAPFADSLLNRNLAIHPTQSPSTMMGGVWQWTTSSYEAYPGYRPPAGAVGEYNGKFMCNQYVLRGGSVATSSHHVRTTYRNFFPADTRWQFSGVRLARSKKLT